MDVPYVHRNVLAIVSVWAPTPSSAATILAADARNFASSSIFSFFPPFGISNNLKTIRRTMLIFAHTEQNSVISLKHAATDPSR